MARWQYQVTVEPISTQPEAVTVDCWWRNLALPVWRRDLAAAEHPALFLPLPIQPETVSEDRWHQPFSQPLYPKPGLAAYQQPFLAEVPNPAPETTSLDRWFQPLSLPQPAKRVLADEPPFLYTPPAVVTLVW